MPDACFTKRPFVRPLILWIGGILLCAFVPGARLLSPALLIPPLFVLLLSLPWAGKGRGLPSYAGRWTWGAVFACLFLFTAVQLVSLRTQPEPLFPRLQTVAAGARQKLAEPVERLRLSEAEKSLLTTITLGDRSRLPKEVRRRFAASGVAHVLSVSGFHIGVVCAALSLLFSVFPAGLFWRRLRYLGTLVLLWAFAFVSGLAPASVRAALMLSFYLSGLQFRRAPDSYNTLAAAAFCMLVYKPAYLFDIGFQLSYLSVLSILYFLPRLQGLLPLRNPLLRKPWQWLWLSVSAQLGVAFLCLYYFGQFSTVFLLANLPLTLLSTLLIPAALVWFLLPGIPFLQEAVEWLTHSMLWVVDTLGRLPGSSLSFHFGLTALLLSYTLLFFLWKLLSKHLPKQKSPLPEGGELL